jgi:hypothetical protein
MLLATYPKVIANGVNLAATSFVASLEFEIHVRAFSFDITQILRIRSAASALILNCSIGFCGLVWNRLESIFFTFIRVSLKGVYFDMNHKKIIRICQYEVPIFPKQYAADAGE